MVQNINSHLDALVSTIISANFGTVQTRTCEDESAFFFLHKLLALISSIVTPTNVTFYWGLHMASSKEHQNVRILTFVLFSSLQPVYCMPA